jgi:serine/threonine protein kinase/tetratricopeptide (TPR) repeat protein
VSTQSTSPDAIFCTAIEIADAEERAAYVARACGNDGSLKRQVENLIAAHFEAGSFLEKPVAAPAATIEELSVNERPGSSIGSYKLLEQIGEGGFGVVFMAEQQEPIRRKVALKVLKPGMDTKQVIARFEAERQALALMDHPNIAHVFAGDETATGRPYFVMELVRGIPITDFCDQNQMPIRQRLELFLTVCQAVQHAHQKGIIHRDIKPSNVLVTLHDDKPVVKVIDFGIAKATGQQLTEKTLFTNFAQMIGTPLYMSPEQAQMSGLDVDTRSDIYSLGVLLYELLTGTTPFDKERLKEIGYDELRRIIWEEEPPRPSTRISTLGQASSTISTQRKSDPKRLTQMLRGELDWIVMQALEKDRNRRYETASAFAADVQRYLNDEPVLACPPSAWYRFRKFARRNRAALLTAGLVAAALVVGLGVATWQAVRASRAEEEKGKELTQKVRENQRANKNLRLALDGFEKIYGDLAEGQSGLANLPHLEGLRKDYLKRLQDFFGEFARANRDDSQAQLEAGKTYRRLGAIQAILGQKAEAEKNIQQAISALQSLPDSGSPEVQLELALSYSACGSLLWNGPRRREAEQYVRKTLAMLKALPPSEDGEFLWALGHVYAQVGAMLGNLGHHQEAEEPLKKARSLFLQLPGRLGGDPDFPRQRAAAMLHDLASVKLNSKDLKGAEAHMRQARDEMEQVFKAKPHVTQFQALMSAVEHDLARLLQVTRRAGEAEKGFRRAFDLRLKLATNFPTVPSYRRWLMDSLHHLDECLQQSAKSAEGLALCENLVKDYPKVLEYQLALAQALTNRGGVLFLQKQWQKGEDLLRRALSLEEKLTPQSPEVLATRCGTLQSLVFVEAAKGRADEAEKICRAHLALRKRWFSQVKDDPAEQPDPLLAAFYARHSTKEARYDVGRPPEKLAQSYGMLIQLLQGMQRWQEISDLYEEALKMLPNEASLNNEAAWFLATCPVAKFRDPARAVRLAEKALDRKEPNQVVKAGDIWNTLGVARYRAGQWEAAVQGLEQSRKLRDGGDAVDWLFLAMAHQKLGHTDQAGKCYAEAIRWLKNNRQVLANPAQAEEFGRFRREAEEVLGLKKK